MKKKLLFVIPALDLGGAEKSFVNLLNSIDYLTYDVDAFIMTRTGLFLDMVPNEVNLLPLSQDFSDFSISLPKSFMAFLKRGKFNLIYQKLAFTIFNRIHQNPVTKEQKSWKYLKHFFSVQPKEYDVAISYLEKTSGYYVIEKTNAKKKIGWIHTDLEALKIDFAIEKKYLERFDILVTVSEGLSERLSNKLPEYADKIKTVENINSKKIIDSLASKKTEIPFEDNSVNIIYVGRLAQEKGLFNALDAMEILIKKGYTVNWYLIGSGNKKNELEMAAIGKGIQNNVHFLGVQSNPYPYIKAADIFILTSFYEGKSISLEEAKILHKPIVVTNFSSAIDQIEHGKTGLIAEMNAESVAENIEKFINDSELRNQFTENLKNNVSGNETEVQKLYRLLN